MILAIYRQHKKQEEEQKHIQEELLQKKKREEPLPEDHEGWQEILDRAYSQCSSYGKVKAKSYRRNYKRKSAH